jgi:hypothetical protein
MLVVVQPVVVLLLLEAPPLVPLVTSRLCSVGFLVDFSIANDN